MGKFWWFLGAGIFLAFSVWLRFINLSELLEIGSTSISAPFFPLVFICIYTIATLLVLPATIFNIASGALFGIGWGLVLATIGCWLAAIIGFAVGRKWGVSWLQTRFANQWLNWSLVINKAGLGYTITTRILPLIPYGVVSLMAGCTPISVRDYAIGTIIGTPLGLAPFVILGYGGKELLFSHHTLALWGAIATTLLLGIATIWCRSKVAGMNND
ncbi:MAG: TVP38/TMEM64 family protein [Pseudanabaenaceae cyanobacterium]